MERFWLALCEVRAECLFIAQCLFIVQCLFIAQCPATACRCKRQRCYNSGRKIDHNNSQAGDTEQSDGHSAPWSFASGY